MKYVTLVAAAALALGLSACGDREAEVTEAGRVEGTADPADLAVGTPGAVTPVGSPCSQYGMLDRDNSGVIDNTEYTAFGDGVFGDWDVNDDNRLARDEYERCWNAGGWTATPAAYNASGAWTRWDDNNDGFLDENEFFGDDEFTEFDANRNGMLEAGEWT